eukprot:2906319-Ditylum_brightwellii.AAC.1
MDDNVPDAIFDELAITAYIDSNHAHDKLTQHSTTGLVIFVGRTPVMYQSKRQGAVETSTYGAEFIVMKTAVEKVSKPTCILGNNRSIIINSTISSSLLKKKHVAISCHMACEATAARIVHPLTMKGDWNFVD